MKIQLTTTRAEAAVTIKAAYDAGTLPAQNGLSGLYYAEVDGKVIRCAIGALYSPEQARTLEGNGPDGPGNYMMAGELIVKGKLKVSDDEAFWFSNIQSAHDNWADTDAERYPDERAKAEKHFLGLLQ